MRAKTVLLLLAFALPARGESPQLTQKMLYGLTPINSMPTKDELMSIFPSNTVNQLAAIARDPNLDFGVRMRAIRALPHFCTPPCANTTPHATLVELLPSSQTAASGQEVLLRRAAIEALGVMRSGDPNDVSRLVAYLSHSSRDIRAATAFALRDLCDADAVPYLRNRYNDEMGPMGVPQVRLAISAALRDLGTCSN